MAAVAIDDEFADWLVRVFARATSEQEDAHHVAAAAQEGHGLEHVIGTLLSLAVSGGDATVMPGPLPSIVVVEVAPPAGERSRIECYRDADGRLVGFAPALPGLRMQGRATDSLTGEERVAVHDLFARTYAEANAEYLNRSLAKLGHIALAWDEEDNRLRGFSLGDQRTLAIPSLGPTPALLAGLACVDPSVRRQGLFRYLSSLSLRTAGDMPEGRTIGAGRMAHPASMRVLRSAPTVMPRPGVVPNELHREVGAAVAQAYGVEQFDADTFVCRGAGEPIGFPVMQQEVDDEEWEVFAGVDRRRGDALLAVIWYSDPPAGW